MTRGLISAILKYKHASRQRAVSPLSLRDIDDDLERVDIGVRKAYEGLTPDGLGDVEDLAKEIIIYLRDRDDLTYRTVMLALFYSLATLIEVLQSESPTVN